MKKIGSSIFLAGTLLALALLSIHWASGSVPRPAHAAEAATAPERAYDRHAARILLANIRVPQADDTGNAAWAKRREVLVETLLRQDPDIVALQEVSPAQGAFLVKNFKGLELVPHTDDSISPLGPVADMMGNLLQIYYRPERWTLAHQETAPLRPEAPQTPLTENAYYSLILLQDRNHLLPDLLIINTHLRHGMPNAVACAQKIHALIALQSKLHPGAQAIVLGDMNHDRTTPAYTALRAEKTDTELLDTFDYTKKAAATRWGTWHNFTGRSIALWPTDLIFISRGLKADAAQIVTDRDAASSVYPSDHFFVETVIRIEK